MIYECGKVIDVLSVYPACFVQAPPSVFTKQISSWEPFVRVSSNRAAVEQMSPPSSLSIGRLLFQCYTKCLRPTTIPLILRDVQTPNIHQVPCILVIQFSSFQSLDESGRRGDMTDDSAEILFQSFLQEAIVSSSGVGRDFHSWMLSIHHFLFRPRCRPPPKVP